MGLVKPCFFALLAVVSLMNRVLLLAVVLLLLPESPACAGVSNSDYAIVASAKTDGDPEWKKVIEALRVKHPSAATVLFTNSVTETLPALRRQFPRYVCFVARPAEAGRQFVAQVHRLTCQFDDDPYPDCFWGILTGYNASNALRIARQSEPLIVRKVASGTDVALDLCEEGVCYNELKQGRLVKKEKGGPAREMTAPADTTEALVKTLTGFEADLFVTSGHATERDWQIGYGYRNGQFRCQDGVLYGLDTHGRKYPIQSPNPKVYLPIGNCLMGHIDNTNAMALAWLNSAGVDQMIGYTVTTWYGYAGWGCLDYFLEQPGRYTLAEAVFANQMALIHRLQTYFPELVTAEADDAGRLRTPVALSEKARAAGLTANDARGLVFDRDVLAFYGDPAWPARMAPGKLAWEQTLSERDGVYTFDLKPNLGDKTFQPVNLNGSQRGGRPIVQFLPHRVKEIKLLAGADLQPLITDDFLLIPNPHTYDPARQYRVVFRAVPIAP
jgi:zinc protease